MRQNLMLLCGLWTSVAATGFLAAAEPRVRVSRDVEYVRRGDEGLAADVYLPAHGEGPYPTILMVHGGAWMAGHKSHSAWHARRLARCGYAVVAIDYRLAPAHRFPAQLEDCWAALRWMGREAERFAFDRQRIGVFGYSAGGHLVCLMALKAAWSHSGDRDATGDVDEGLLPIRAVIAGGAPCDFRDVPPDSKRLAFWLGGTLAERPEIYRDASPAAWLTPDAPPMFFFHGSEDRVVPPNGVRDLHASLRELGVTSQLYLVERQGHLGAYVDRQAWEHTVAFLHETLAMEVPK